jgi:triphosphatase
MEVEAKYTVPDVDVFERVRGLTALGDYELQPAAEQSVTDHYLDTADWALLRGGYACRLREHTGGWRATVKGVGGAEGALHQREEFEVDIAPGAPPAQWPESLARAVVLSLCGASPLAEVFVLRQKRAVRAVHHGERWVAEASLDVLDIEAGQRSTVAYELEIELRPAGTLDDLSALALPLGALGLQPQPQSKFERALVLLGMELPAVEPKKPKPLGLRADEPMAEAARKILRFHCGRMLANEAGTRAGTDIEAVHDMRVATRRQRSALRLFAPYFRRKTVRPFGAALRELAGHLGAVRDLDVMLDAARAHQSTLGEGAPAFQPLLEAWAAQRETERIRLLAYLDSDAYHKFIQAYGDFLGTPGVGVKAEAGRPQPLSVAHALPGKVWEQFAAVRAYEAVLPWADVPILHMLRIEAKRVRYSLEFFREILPPCADDAITALVALQDHIGRLHDAEVAQGLTREFLLRSAHAHQPPEVIDAAGRYLQMLHEQLNTLRRTVNKPWRKVASKRMKQWLTRAVREL